MDILCLQEVERPVFESQLSQSLPAFQAGMHSLGQLAVMHAMTVNAQPVLGHVQGWAHFRSSAAVPGPDEGPCLFLRKSRFETLAHRVVRCATPATPCASTCLIILVARRMGVHYIRRFRDALAPDIQGAFWDIVRERDDGAVLALARDRQSKQVMLAACTHLYHDPRFPDVKVAEAQLLCSEVPAAPHSWWILVEQSAHHPKPSSALKDCNMQRSVPAVY